MPNLNFTPDGIALYFVHGHELKEHLVKRAAYHVKKNAELMEKGKELDKNLTAQIDERDSTFDRMAFKGSANYGSGAHERERLFDRAREHARQATRFNFLAEHAQTGEFWLCEEELVKLEFYDAH